MNKYRLLIIFLSIILLGIIWDYFLIFSDYIYLFNQSFINLISDSLKGMIIELSALSVYLSYKIYKEKKRKQVKKE